MSRPSNQESKAFHDKLDKFGDVLKAPGYGGPSWARYRTPMDGDYAAEHPRYPDFHYPDDKDADTIRKAKDEILNAYSAYPFMSMTDKDIDYFLRKKDTQELVRFKQFVEDSIPRGTPWAKEFFEKIMPGWYQSKVDIINEKMDIIKKFIDITVRGPQTIDDMFLLYQIYQGRITIPANFSDVIRPATQGVDVPNFYSGLFNPKRYLTVANVMARRNQEFMSSFVIPGIDMKGVAYGTATGGDWGTNNNTATTWDNANWRDRAGVIQNTAALAAANPGLIGSSMVSNRAPSAGIAGLTAGTRFLSNNHDRY